MEGVVVDVCDPLHNENPRAATDAQRGDGTGASTPAENGAADPSILSDAAAASVDIMSTTSARTRVRKRRVTTGDAETVAARALSPLPSLSKNSDEQGKDEGWNRLQRIRSTLSRTENMALRAELKEELREELRAELFAEVRRATAMATAGICDEVVARLRAKSTSPPADGAKPDAQATSAAAAAAGKVAEDGDGDEIALEPSLWSVPLIMCTDVCGGAASVQLTFLLVLNILIQYALATTPPHSAKPTDRRGHHVASRCLPAYFLPGMTRCTCARVRYSTQILLRRDRPDCHV